MPLPVRHIVEPFLRIAIRHTNRGHLGQVSSEARLARRNALLCLLQSRPLRPWTPGRRILRLFLRHLFLHPIMVDLLVTLDPLPHPPWMLLLYDGMAIQITALALSISPKHLCIPTLWCQLYQILSLQNCMPQRQPDIVISLPSSASMGRQPLLWST